MQRLMHQQILEGFRGVDSYTSIYLSLHHGKLQGFVIAFDKEACTTENLIKWEGQWSLLFLIWHPYWINCPTINWPGRFFCFFIVVSKGYQKQFALQNGESNSLSMFYLWIIMSAFLVTVIKFSRRNLMSWYPIKHQDYPLNKWHYINWTEWKWVGNTLRCHIKRLTCQR